MGPGKPTLLKILAGAEQADSGAVELHSSARLSYLEQAAAAHAGRTLWKKPAAGSSISSISLSKRKRRLTP